MSRAMRITVIRYGLVPLAGATAVTLALMLFDVTHPAHAAGTLLRSLVYACSITAAAGLALDGAGLLCGAIRARGRVLRGLLTIVVLLACAGVGTFVGGVALVVLGLDVRSNFWEDFWFSLRISVLMTFTVGLAMLGYEAFRERVHRLDRLKQFFSAPVAELIVSGTDADPLRSRRREVTVVFLDLRGFTAFAEAAEPEDEMRVLHEYHAAVGTQVLQWNATLERFTGDGMMIFFNDLVPVANPAERAL